MFTDKRALLGVILGILVIILAGIEIGILEKSPRSLYILEGPSNGQSKTAVVPVPEQHSHVENLPAITDPPMAIVPTIAFLIPARSIDGWTIQDIPLLNIFLPSLLGTITPDEFRDFNYVIYFGCDTGDPLYDNDETVAKLHDIVEKMSEIRLLMFSFGNTQGKPVLVWNRLFSEAFQDGCHYFYQVNDDVRFITSGWTRSFVNTLRGNPVFPDLGVTGPRDLGAQILTQAFVSRIHMHIFSSFYPSLFDNWYSDDWLTHVYDDIGSTFGSQSVLVKNDNSQGTRYKVDHSGRDSLDILERNGKAVIREFLDTHVAGPTIYSDPVHKEARRNLFKRSHTPGDAVNVNK